MKLLVPVVGVVFSTGAFCCGGLGESLNRLGLHGLKHDLGIADDAEVVPVEAPSAAPHVPLDGACGRFKDWGLKVPAGFTVVSCSDEGGEGHMSLVGEGGPLEPHGALMMSALVSGATLSDTQPSPSQASVIALQRGETKLTVECVGRGTQTNVSMVLTSSARETSAQGKDLDAEIAKNAAVLAASNAGDAAPAAHDEPAPAAVDSTKASNHAGGSSGEGGTVRLCEVVVLGPVDPANITAVISKQRAALQYCYQRELTKNPSLGGKLLAKITVYSDGTVTSATTDSSTLANASVESCVVGRLQSLRFSEPSGGGIAMVKLPLTFTP
jgi:hypothetical protein